MFDRALEPKGQLMANIMLLPHPAFPSSYVRSVGVDLTVTDRCDVLLKFRIEGGDVVISERQSSERADDLWKSTCFELFLRDPRSELYFEYNFSPSSRWAAYAFDGYRQGMRNLDMAVEPNVEFDPARPLDLRVDLNLSDLPNVPMLANISAVIEERDGTLSYWAVAHSPGDRPDFHHADCFVIEIPAARPA